jgi:hypothetical protein
LHSVSEPITLMRLPALLAAVLLVPVFGEVEKVSKQIQAETNHDTRREITPPQP